MGPEITWADIDAVPVGVVDEVTLARLESVGWLRKSLNIGTAFRTSWTWYYTLREYVQNALDSAGRCDISVAQDDNGRVMSLVSDDGAGFPLSSLTFRETKTSEEARRCLRGFFGEGMKLAVIPVVRNGNRVFIRTVGMDVMFVIVSYTHGGRHALEEIFALTRDNNVTVGTTVALEGLDATHGQIGTATHWRDGERVEDPIYADLRLRFLPFLATLRPEAIIHSVFDGCTRRDVLLDRGVIFVRDIFVQAGASWAFGYNFWFRDLEEDKPLDPNRDRLTLDSDSYVLRAELARLVMSMPSDVLFTYVSRLYELSNSYISENRVLAQNGCLGDSTEFAQRLYDVIVKVVGTDKFSWAFSHDARGAAVLEYHGYMNLYDKLPNGFYYLLESKGLVKSVSRVASAIQDDSIIVVAPADFARAEKRLAEANRGKATSDVVRAYKTLYTVCNDIARFVRKQDYAAPVPVDFYLPLSADKESAQCLAFTNQSRILIRLDEITDGYGGNVIRSLVHELGHVVSTGKDLTALFEHGLAIVAERMLRYAQEYPRRLASLIRASRALKCAEAREIAALCGAGRAIKINDL